MLGRNRFLLFLRKFPDLPRFITNKSSPHTTSDTSTHMSTLERCSPTTLDSSDLIQLHENSDDALPSTCSICYQALSWDMAVAEAKEPVQLACGHIFGAPCIQTWSTLNTTCPICRAEFDLDLQNDAVAASSWQHQIDTDSPLTGYASEYFEMRGDFTTLISTTDQLEEDMWLTLANDETNTLCTSRRRRFSVYEDDIMESHRSTKRHKHVNWVSFETCHSYTTEIDDVSFDELINSHEEWMTCTSSFEELDDEFAVGYYDVLASW